MSTYGDVLLAGVSGGDLYLSTNGGSVWNDQNSAPSGANATWDCVFCSADGGQLTAGLDNDSIYHAVNPLPAPSLMLNNISNQGVISWPVFPAGFTLQTSGTLVPAAWTDVSIGIGQSGTDYFYTNSFTGFGAFFRLAKP
jgi:hypothetical protein